MTGKVPSGREINQNTSPQHIRHSRKCRVCLQLGNMPIFSKNNSLDFPLSHYLKLICNVDITANDAYPQYLCESCFDTLNSAIKLRKTAIKTQLELKVFRFGCSTKNGYKNTKHRHYLKSSSPLPKQYKTEFKAIEHDCDAINGDFGETDPIENSTVPMYLRKNITNEYNEEQISEKEETSTNEYNEEQISEKEETSTNEVPIVTLEQLRKLDSKDIQYNVYYKKLSTLNIKPEYECRICSKVLKKASIADHLKTHLPDSVTLHVCEVCGKSFKKFCSLYNHRIIHSNKLPYECKLCPYKGRSKSLLRVHTKRHKKEYNYKCTLCPRTFIDTNILRYHLRRHGKPTFQCDTCQKLFYEKGALKTHIDQHNNMLPLTCKDCGNSYKNRRNLLAHEIKVHKRKQVYNNRATYLKLNQCAEVKNIQADCLNT